MDSKFLIDEGTLFIKIPMTVALLGTLGKISWCYLLTPSCSSKWGDIWCYQIWKVN